MWETLTQGGILMVPLAVCSVLGLAIALERAISLRASVVLKKPILDLIQSAAIPEDLGLARTLCDRNPCAMASVARTGLDGYGLTREQIRESMSDTGRREVHRLERGLAALETIAVISPLLGLLGTGFGMIDVFRVVAAQGVGQAQMLSAGIAEALITTVTGLSIAIPMLVAYNSLTRKVEDLTVSMEHCAVQLLNRLAPGGNDTAGLEDQV